jgi:hypothetical protein
MMLYYFIPIRMVAVDKDVEKLELSYTAGGRIVLQDHLGKQSCHLTQQFTF